MSCSGCFQTIVRTSPVLLTHINLLLMLGSGAGLATSARLAWDPSTYVVLTLVYPAEYNLSVTVLPIISIVLICLAHMVLITLRLRQSILKRVLLCLYAAFMVVLALTELICLLYIWRPILALGILLVAVQAKIDTIKHGVLSLLLEIEFLQNLLDTIEEVIRKIPFNLYVAGLWSAAIAILQIASILLALLAVFDRSRTAIKQFDPESGIENIGDRNIHFTNLTHLLKTRESSSNETKTVQVHSK